MLAFGYRSVHGATLCDGSGFAAPVLPAGRYVLRFHELHQAVMAAFTPNAALLDSAKWRSWIRHQPAIKPDHAAFKSIRNPQPARQVAGINIGHQSVFSAVGQRHGSIIAIKGNNRCYGSENLFIQQFGVGRHINQHRSGIKIAWPRRWLPASQGPRAFGQRVGDQLRHLVTTFRIDQGTERRGRVERVAHHHTAHFRSQAFAEFRADFALDIEAIGCSAGFAAVAHLG
ncbi:MAG: hypothetical protein JWR21_3875 [Herminiimonas sp.]|nr:hypothetical protein [Herminiimonas sp.]